ncbi:MAG: GNAT family N-acetyltransferase [Clostridia bacterium]|nr:GNAT family N-acetyltransferase [Clostridia bacterium]
MLNFRDATAEDAGLISHIFCTSWRKTYRGLIPEDYLIRLPDAYWVPSLRSWLESGQLYGLIAMEDKRPVGCVIYGRGRDAEYADWGEIVSLYMLPDCMRRGVGGALLNEALRLLRADGFDRCYLWAIEGNAIADGFYRKHGFSCTGERIPYRIGGKDVADLRYTLA